MQGKSIRESIRVLHFMNNERGFTPGWQQSVPLGLRQFFLSYLSAECYPLNNHQQKSNKITANNRVTISI